MHRSHPRRSAGPRNAIPASSRSRSRDSVGAIPAVVASAVYLDDAGPTAVQHQKIRFDDAARHQ
jgi:hypothetical protein